MRIIELTAVKTGRPVWLVREAITAYIENLDEEGKFKCTTVWLGLADFDVKESPVRIYNLIAEAALI